jgi:hypothetical protein
MIPQLPSHEASGEAKPLHGVEADSCERMDDCERKFGQLHARLFPFIGRKVRTPAGPGTLWQVFADRVTVLLDSAPTTCAMFMTRDIAPSDLECARN